MQKKIIALAIAGLASSAAFAADNVTIYGRIDYGFMTRSGNSGGAADTGTTNNFGAGLQGGSRIGFKGAEDLGNGLKAIFEMEFGSIKNDQNVGMTGMRHSYVGLTGNFGTVVGGRLDGVRYGIFNKYDAFGGGNMGNFTQMTGQVDRANNAVAYISPTFSGFTGVLAYATHVGDSNPLSLSSDETTGNKGDAVLTTAMLGYENGPFSANIDWEQVDFRGGATSGAAFTFQKDQVATVGASYDFGVVKLAALYDDQKLDLRTGGVGANIHSWFVSASAPVGSSIVLKATYGQTDDSKLDNDKGRKLGLGGDYMLSKRTKFYASYGQIFNGSAASHTITPYANDSVNGIGTRGFDLGMAHTF